MPTKIDELIDQVADPGLRTQLRAAAAQLRQRKKFGLVFEEHVPESVVLAGQIGIQPGNVVTLRSEPQNKTRWNVESVAKTKAKITDGTTTRTEAVKNLLVVKAFGEPVYPVLKPCADPITNGGDKPYNVVINGENFHALQLLLFAYEQKVDCIYIDPPYNTGDRNWKYNNDYIDNNDAWRHSKWLSFMERRLRLAKRLLKPDGVLIVTIDEHEVANLSVLLAEKHLFGDARRQMVTIVNNAAGVSQGGFYRVEEYALFCFLGSSRPGPVDDDLLADETKKVKVPVWRSFNRFSGINVFAAKRPNLVYPVLVDTATGRIVGTGRSLKERQDACEVSGDLNAWRPDPAEDFDGKAALWPYKGDGSLATWEASPDSLMKLVKDGYARARPSADAPGGYSVTYVKTGTRKKVETGEIELKGREPDDGPLILGAPERKAVPKTVWKRSRHDAGKWGSRTLRELLGSVSFDYAKSPYAVLDTLRTIVGDRPDALVLDFFAGSGTTAHALAMLNAEDDGRRHSISVTNNQVTEAAEMLLAVDGCYQGDDAYEAQGIARAVTIPRIHAAFTGKRDNKKLEGEYQDGRKLAEGFDENVVFFDLVYEDPDRIDVGARFPEVLPALWLTAGSLGDPTGLDASKDWFLDPDAPFAVLLDEDRLSAFRKALAKRDDITHVWLVTDSEPAFARMRSRMPDTVSVHMLYRDYLRNFRINTEN